MLKDYLQELKTKGGYSWADISELSNIPEITVRKIVTGETENPRIDTVIAIVTALGGSLNAIVNNDKEEESEMNPLTLLRESYEKRICDNKEHIKSLERDKKALAIVSAFLVVVILAVLIADIWVRSHGWIQY